MTDHHEHVDADLMNVYKKIARAVQKVGQITKDKTADTGKYEYHYADLTQVLQVVKTALTEQGLVLLQPITPNGEGSFAIMTTLIDGDTGISVNFPGPVFQVRPDPQAIGSAISYGRRYALTTLFALEVEDDDGALAHRAETQPGQRTEAEKKIRKWVEGLPDAMAKEDFQAEFVAAFGSGLTNLPESKHGDALTWVVEYATKHTMSHP